MIAPMNAIAAKAGAGLQFGIVKTRAKAYTAVFVVKMLRKTLAATWAFGYAGGSHVWSRMNAAFTPMPTVRKKIDQMLRAGVPAGGLSRRVPVSRNASAAPAASIAPPNAWNRRYRYPAPIASPRFSQIRRVEVTAISSQKIRRVIQSPANTAPMEVAAYISA